MPLNGFPKGSLLEMCLFYIKDLPYVYTIVLNCPEFSFTGGNQRDLARAKNAKKNADQAKGNRNDDGLSLEARKQRYVPFPESLLILIPKTLLVSSRDADLMRLKQKKKEEEKAAADAAAAKK